MNPKASVNSLTIESRHQDNHFYQFNPEIFTSFSSDVFNASYWQQQNKVVGTAQGRGTTWFIQHNSHQIVLRHYFRGGLIGKLLNDGYLFTGLEKSRPYLEFFLLKDMFEFGLPVPEPLAYALTKKGLYYTADIVTRRIENAKDLVGILSQNAVEAGVWQEIGHTIRQFHEHGINHHDLNCHNILIDDNNKVWIIDFDQGKKMPSAGDWQQSNIDRLKRSFLKELNRLPTFYWQEDNWQQLMQGYEAASK